MQTLTKFFKPKEKIHSHSDVFIETPSPCASNNDFIENDNSQRTITLNNNPTLKGTIEMNQPIIDFPVKLIAGQKSKFNAAWYKRYSWNNYDVASDSNISCLTRNLSNFC
jgi:hypothetical protein